MNRLITIAIVLLLFTTTGLIQMMKNIGNIIGIRFGKIKWIM